MTFNLLHLTVRSQWVIIVLLLGAITMIHNVIHLSTTPFVMILVQKLFFLPVIFAGFCSGLVGGMIVAFLAALIWRNSPGPSTSAS